MIIYSSGQELVVKVGRQETEMIDGSVLPFKIQVTGPFGYQVNFNSWIWTLRLVRLLTSIPLAKKEAEAARRFENKSQ